VQNTVGTIENVVYDPKENVIVSQFVAHFPTVSFAVHSECRAYSYSNSSLFWVELSGNRFMRKAK
jgi:hypothetical protein